MKYKILHFNKILNEKMKKDIWELLCLADKDFVPKLSARESSYTGQLSSEEKINIKPYSYFETMIQQKFFVAVDKKENVIGFMSYKDDYVCEELKEYSPSSYGTTAYILKEWRKEGIGKIFFEKWEEQVKKEKN